ncbi:SMI1/KNR4 family protein [uncultured Tenacibaculum sp.]|uniref:SMI1/KNR4 family protein n=1 Tax=uncultured Tenacibaculum sp. TaxID=174713 RepID=UPI00260537E2|nr:SMI1/KNR4 family protein [uncultured Tenacibaculum sp.]
MKATTLKAFIITLVFILAFGGLSIYISHKSESNAAEKNVAEKLQIVKKVRDQIDSIDFDSKMEDQTMDQVISLLDDHQLHGKSGAKFTHFDIQEIEQDSDLVFPQSFVLFLEYFGNKAQLYGKYSLRDIKKPIFLSECIDDISRKVAHEDGDEISANSILCLTSINAKKGIWCWLVDSENSENGEWPIAFFNKADQKLYYEVENFNEWLSFLIEHKNRPYDVTYSENDAINSAD